MNFFDFFSSKRKEYPIEMVFPNNLKAFGLSLPNTNEIVLITELIEALNVFSKDHRKYLKGNKKLLLMYQETKDIKLQTMKSQFEFSCLQQSIVSTALEVSKMNKIIEQSLMISLINTFEPYESEIKNMGYWDINNAIESRSNIYGVILEAIFSKENLKEQALLLTSVFLIYFPLCQVRNAKSENISDIKGDFVIPSNFFENTKFNLLFMPMIKIYIEEYIRIIEPYMKK
ncbi:hypothetical protein [Chitinophaga sp. GbtcB8]|uniref:hypothetical protein n=1 Tax=Chitinophaga sp. GbtcB8 TaxID=2824753 RepID=UPI001C30B1CB|nr:hypothetical protein [Chitinophaga sp. GbtcB8]